MKQTFCKRSTCVCAKMQTGSRRDFSHKSNAGRPTERSVVLLSIFSLKPILKSAGIKCQEFLGCEKPYSEPREWAMMLSLQISNRHRLLSTTTEMRFVWARATSSSYPPSSDSMTKVPTLGMATSTVRWPGDSSSVTRSGGGVEGVFTWTSGWGEVGGGRDCRDNGTDETGRIRVQMERLGTLNVEGKNTVKY